MQSQALMSAQDPELELDIEQRARVRRQEDDYVRWLGARGRWPEIAVPLVELMGAVRETQVLIPAELRGGFVACNPSVHVMGDRRLAIVRGVNYRQGTGGVTLFDAGEDRCVSRNWWCEFDRDWRLQRASTIVDPYPERPGAVQGYEDCRLFWSDGSYWASCSFAERPKLIGPNAFALLCEMALIRFSDEGEIADVKAIRGPWSTWDQKNWKPAPSMVHPLRWIYSSDPMVLVTPADARSPHNIRYLPASPWRGSSQAVRLGDHWLWVDHRPIVRFDGQRNLYLHRFVLADAELQRVEAVSPPFVFRSYQIEFCAGLALDGDQAVISYSMRDGFAFVAQVAIADVVRCLR